VINRINSCHVSRDGGEEGTNVTSSRLQKKKKRGFHNLRREEKEGKAKRDRLCYQSGFNGNIVIAKKNRTGTPTKKSICLLMKDQKGEDVVDAGGRRKEREGSRKQGDDTMDACCLCMRKKKEIVAYAREKKETPCVSSHSYGGKVLREGELGNFFLVDLSSLITVQFTRISAGRVLNYPHSRYQKKGRVS